MSNLQDDSLCQAISEICTESFEVSDKRKVLDDCIKMIKKTNMDKKLSRLQDEIKLAQSSKDEEKVLKLINEYSSLVKKLQEEKV